MREQSSWGDDTNPFCCDRCSQSSLLHPELPGEEETTTVPPPTDDPSCRNNGSSYPQHSAVEGEEHEETSVLGASGSRLGNNGNTSGGDASNSNSRAADGNQPPSRLFATAISGSLEETEVRGRGRSGANHLMPATPVDPGIFRLEDEKAAVLSLPVEANSDGMEGSQRGGAGPPPPPRRPEAIAAAFAVHLHGVDKNPLELARLCRFAQFLTESELLREAYEVNLQSGGGRRHSISTIGVRC